MTLKLLKNHNLALSYEKISEEGKSLTRSQKFDFIPENATADDLLDIGNSIKSVLENAIKEVTENLTFIIMEE